MTNSMGLNVEDAVRQAGGGIDTQVYAKTVAGSPGGTVGDGCAMT